MQPGVGDRRLGDGEPPQVADLRHGTTGTYVGHGPWEQVSRLGNPLFNEVIVPMAEKDEWNARPPAGRQARSRSTSTKPELAGLLPVLYPGVFPNLAAYTKPRADLNAILLTGIPAGVVPGFQNFTGAVAGRHAAAQRGGPAVGEPEPRSGLVAGDPAGFPNGRRVDDDVVTIELRAIAGLTIPLVDPSFTPDGAASAVTDGTTNTNAAATGHVPVPRACPGGGYQTDARHDDGVMSTTAARDARTRTPGRARSCSTSADDVGALVVAMPAVDGRASRSRSGPSAAAVRRPPPARRGGGAAGRGRRRSRRWSTAS